MRNRISTLALGFAASAFFTFSALGDLVTNRFGFVGKEVFPIEFQISHLRAVDLDGDGLRDLVVVNNARSKINLLYNRTGRTNEIASEKSALKRELNELPPDARFQIDSIASEMRISSLVVTDLNGDGRPDLAYYGEPRELIVLYNEGEKAWSLPRRWPVTDGKLTRDSLAFGDMNGDNRTDLLLLADNAVYLLAQDEKHSLGEPERIPYSGTVQTIQVADIDGDHRDDLLLVNWESLTPFRFRLQNKRGQLGPEMYFSQGAIRSFCADDLDGDHKAEIVTIAQKSGRAEISQFKQKASEPLSGDWVQGQFNVMPIGKSEGKRGMIWTDITQDDRADLIVAEPDSGELAIYLQEPDGGLSVSGRFSTLSGVGELASGDWDEDGQPEIFLLSSGERQVGISTPGKDRRVPFPKILPLDGNPLSLTVGRLKSDAPPALVLVVDRAGKREVQMHGPEGVLARHALSESFKSNPSSITLHDVNQDGLPDLVLLVPYEKMKILLQKPQGDFAEVDAALPGGSNVDQPWVSSADVDGDGKPELLLPQKNFVRAVVIDHNPEAKETAAVALVIKDQINGAAGNSRIVGAAALRNGDRKVPSLFLLDAERKFLTLCERTEGGGWHVVKNMMLPVSEFSRLQTLPGENGLGSKISLLGPAYVGWMNLSGDVWEFASLDGYETPIKDAYLHDVVSGDLDNDGRKDLVFLETTKGYVDVVTYEAPNRLAPSDRWQVFEERTFRSRRSDAPEPREALILDVTNDGKNDLILLVHDRIIVYPQE